MSVLATVRHRLARSPWIYWAVVAVLAVVAGVAVASATSGVDAARRAWGDVRAVYVASSDIAPGDQLAGRVDRRELPAPLIPGDALIDVSSGAVARQHVAAGEVLVSVDVAASGSPRSLIPADWLAVAVAERVPSGVSAGDAVRVASGGIVLADEGVVVAASPDAVLVAVPADDAAQVGQAASTGDVSLLLEP
ncbi:SAF domain-containing protein [Desertimonas flava]|uniref:SAF domain-containing protein n=1 Tax=Desertimonas flava TaxID=2064846 RepID=UPI000E34411B|nr:SAF domain-containing protein [Desertimonas flava]